MVEKRQNAGRVFPSIAFAMARTCGTRWRAIIEKRFARPQNIPPFQLSLIHAWKKEGMEGFVRSRG